MSDKEKLLECLVYGQKLTALSTLNNNVKGKQNTKKKEKDRYVVIWHQDKNKTWKQPEFLRWVWRYQRGKQNP